MTSHAQQVAQQNALNWKRDADRKHETGPVTGVNVDAELKEEEENDQLEEDQKAKPYFKIKDLPPEIRLLIWTECLSPLPSATTPANGTDGESKLSHLIAALRPDAEMYYEALEVFFAVKKFIIDKGMKKGIQATSPAVLRRIGEMEVRYS